MTTGRSLTRRVAGACLGLVLGSAGLAAQGVEDGAFVLKEFGSFHIGGRTAEITGKPVKEVLFTPGGAPATVDPNGTYQVEQLYVQYFVPKEGHGSIPLLLWHGGGLTGVTYETTPDGREGWLQAFLRKGWTVYNSDAVERGRSSFPPPDLIKGEPLFLTVANPFERFRIGPGPGSWSDDPAKRKVNPGSQFPMEGYANFTKQVVPRWTTTDEAILAAYRALVGRVCPCVILFHSQAGQFGFKVAQEMPDKVKALVAVEPATVGYLGCGSTLKGVPTLMVFGDFIEEDPRWKRMRETAGKFADEVTAAGGSVEFYDLPKLGIPGNSHMLMMDRNNGQIADLIDGWLSKHSLKR